MPDRRTSDLTKVTSVALDDEIGLVRGNQNLRADMQQVKDAVDTGLDESAVDDRVTTGIDSKVADWARTGNTEDVPADKLGNAPPAGQSESQVDARVEAGTQPWARAGDATAIPSSKLSNAPEDTGKADTDLQNISLDTAQQGTARGLLDAAKDAPPVTPDEARDGTLTDLRRWSPERVRQAADEAVTDGTAAWGAGWQCRGHPGRQAGQCPGHGHLRQSGHQSPERTRRPDRRREGHLPYSCRGASRSRRTVAD